MVFLIVAVVLSHYFKMLPVVNRLVLETPTPANAAPGGKGANEESSDHRFPVHLGLQSRLDHRVRVCQLIRTGHTLLRSGSESQQSRAQC